MRAIASGLSLAKDLNIDYKIIWLSNWEIMAKADDIFNLPDELKSKIEYPSSFKYNFLYSAPGKRNLLIPKLTLKRFGFVKLWSEIDEWPDSAPEIIQLYKDGFRVKHQCYLQGGTDMYPYSASFYRYIFQPTAEIQSAVSERILQLDEHGIGIHIRRTDNKESIHYSTDDMFISEMDRIITDEPATKFYLATDSEITKQTFKKRYGDHLLMSPNKARRDTLDGIKDAAIELFTLANTKAILGSYYSSFSEAASLLGNTSLRQLKK